MSSTHCPAHAQHSPTPPLPAQLSSMKGTDQLTSCAMCRAAYEQETRTTILGLDRVSKVAPNGKEILKDVRIAMYKGAKIGR